MSLSTTWCAPARVSRRCDAGRRGIDAEFARYFTPALAQYLSHANCWVSAGGYMRTSLHYHQVLPTYLEAMQLGIAAGRALKRPLFLESWEDYLDWPLEDIAPHFGFVRGPVDAWAWTNEATSG